MDLMSDPEKQLLIKTYLEPLTRMSPTEVIYSDSELSEDACNVDGLWLYQEMASENETRHVPRRKLLTACAVSLVFMTGEVIGGYAARNLGIMTDPVHLLTDFGSIAIILPGGFFQASNTNHDF